MLSAAYRQALQSLADIRARLAGNLSAAERDDALSEFDAVLSTLKQADRNTSTLSMASRVAHLDRQLRELPSAERNAAIQSRLGVSRSRLYELRQIVRNCPDGNAGP